MIIAAIILANLSLGLVLIGATEWGTILDIEKVEEQWDVWQPIDRV